MKRFFGCSIWFHTWFLQCGVSCMCASENLFRHLDLQYLILEMNCSWRSLLPNTQINWARFEIFRNLVLIEQWLSNCGTRTISGTRRGLLSVFLHKQYIHSCSFYLWGSVNKFLNFCVAHLPCCFLKTTIKIYHSHFVHVAFVSILVFQTFDRMIFGTLTFPGTKWYVITVRDTQMVHDQKKFENHCYRDTL